MRGLVVARLVERLLGSLHCVGLFDVLGGRLQRHDKHGQSAQAEPKRFGTCHTGVLDLEPLPHLPYHAGGYSKPVRGRLKQPQWTGVAGSDAVAPLKVGSRTPTQLPAREGGTIESSIFT